MRACVRSCVCVCVCLCECACVVSVDEKVLAQRIRFRDYTIWTTNQVTYNVSLVCACMCFVKDVNVKAQVNNY